MADLDKETWENVDAYFESMDPQTYLIGVPTKMVCHDLCTKTKAPAGIERLLGLGGKYCIKSKCLSSKPIDTMMDRMRTSIRWKYIFRHEEDDKEGENYIPKLHINTDVRPEPASDEIESSMNEFEQAMRRERMKYYRKPCLPNLTPLQEGLIKLLNKNTTYKVAAADKNCGLVIAETEYLTEGGVREHLSNENVYKRLSRREAMAQLQGVESLVMSFWHNNQGKMSRAELTFLRRGYKRDRGRIAKFYTTVKIHKNPHTLRPIVATCGTVLSNLSKWLDYKLKKLLPFMTTYIKDSNDLRQKLKELGHLPENARLVVADAISMYPSIDTEHALRILRKLLEEWKREGKLPKYFDVEMIIKAARIVMCWNLLEYGDCCFKNKNGTAMGTPAAVLWAIIYFHWPETKMLIPKYGEKMPLFARFIDDIFIVALIGGEDGLRPSEWNDFKRDLNSHGMLRWTIKEPSMSVDYLDLTVTIENGIIATKTYQKPMNLYQYITPNSAHPPWMIKGVITSMLRNYFHQNTHRSDYWDIAMKFYTRLRERGWDRKTLEPIFIAAHNKFESQSEKIKSVKKDESSEKLMILHLEYHPNEIPRKKIRKLWHKHCGDLLSKTITEGGLGIEKTVIAYSRPKNLKDVLQSAKLHQHPGKEVSTYF